MRCCQRAGSSLSFSYDMFSCNAFVYIFLKCQRTCDDVSVHTYMYVSAHTYMYVSAHTYMYAYTSNDEYQHVFIFMSAYLQ